VDSRKREILWTTDTLTSSSFRNRLLIRPVNFTSLIKDYDISATPSAAGKVVKKLLETLNFQSWSRRAFLADAFG
jgi:hypothetical protein